MIRPATSLQPTEYDAYGRPTIYDPNLTAERNSSNYENYYLFTGRRVDILDNGSLEIQYNRNHYYDYYTGRWLTHDPLGIVPNAEKLDVFNAVMQYTDSVSLYEYARSNPIIATDPMGKIASCPAKEPEGDPAFCDDSGIGSWLHFPLRCYREVVPIGSITSCGLWPCGNQCCYSEAGEFCEQSPDCVAPAVGGGGGKCEYDECRAACHGIMDVGFGCGDKLPKPKAPPVGTSCPK